jgi:hypothetical protein
MHKLFESQLENEKVYMIIRQHWLALFVKYAVISVMFAFGLALWIYVPRFLGDFFSDEISLAFALFMYLYMLGLLLGTLLVTIFYYLHLQIITDLRMVDVDQLSLFRRNVSEIQIENVEEVTSKSHGFLATLFNYGDITVQTSGSKIEFEFERVAHPEQIKKMILDLYEKRNKGYNHQLVQNPAKQNFEEPA